MILVFVQINNFDLLWKNDGDMEKKLWYYGKNYDNIPKTIELRFTMEKLWYYGKTMVILPG